MNSYEKSSRERIFTSQFLLAFGALFFTSLVMYVLMSPITEYAQAMGYSVALSGLASGMYVVGGLISLMLSGHALKFFGWKKTAFIFLGIHLIACFLYFIANDIVSLLIARFVHGFGMGASGSVIITIASPIFPKTRFNEAMGYFLVGTTLAVGVGPYVGELIFNNLGPDNCFIAAALFAALAIICMFFVKIQEDDSQSNKKSKKDYKGIRKVFEPKAIPISVTSALLSFGYLAIISFHGVYSKDVNMANVFGYFFIIYAISLMISRPLAGKIQDKYGDWIVTVIPITLQSIGIFLMAFYPSALSIVICAVCTALGFGTFYSVANSMVANIVSKDRSPYAISTYLFVVDFALGFGP